LTFDGALTAKSTLFQVYSNPGEIDKPTREAACEDKYSFDIALCFVKIRNRVAGLFVGVPVAPRFGPTQTPT
jgi:hypothetical protein